jgi:glyoxylate reductase
MNSKRILITRNFPEIGAGLLKLEGFEISQWTEDRPLKPDELRLMAANHQVLFCTISDQIDKEFFQANPQLEMISQFGVGYDNIDVAEATRLGIPIGYTPDVLTDATADIAFGLMIATSRKMFYQYTEIQKGNWNTSGPIPILELN